MKIVRKFQDGILVEFTVNGVAQPLDGNKAAMIVAAHVWPFWAKALRLLAKPEDKGIGDVIARTIGYENSQAFKTWYKRIFGKDCGCSGRQAQWNALYPLPGKMVRK